MNKNLRLEECKAIAEEAHRQLFCSISHGHYYSWGVSALAYREYEGMPTLMLRVSGLIHKGWVYVSLNEGKDVYEVRLMGNEGNVVKVVDEVYFDTLGSTIDMLIERPAGMSDEEYRSRAIAAYEAANPDEEE